MKTDIAVRARLLYLQSQTIPVDVVRLAGQIGIDIQLTDLGNFSGYYMSAPNGAYMVINQKHPDVRRRWTIAHEIGHHVMPSTREATPYSIRCYSARERTCNRFAALLLMPEDEVRRRLPLYLRHTWDETAKEMGRHFDVSSQAALVRLKELGILTPDPLETAPPPDQMPRTIFKALAHMPENVRLVATEQVAEFISSKVR